MTGSLPPISDHIDITEEAVASCLATAWQVSIKYASKRREEDQEECRTLLRAIWLRLRRGIPGMQWPLPKNGPLAEHERLAHDLFLRTVSNHHLSINPCERKRHVQRIFQLIHGEEKMNAGNGNGNGNGKPIVVVSGAGTQQKAHVSGVDVWAFGRTESEATADLDAMLARKGIPIRVKDCEIRYR